jgi:urease accessory protein UreH
MDCTEGDRTMTDYADTRALEIASMIDEKQRYVAIYAYGDQRAREALERAATLARDDDGKFSWSGEDRNAVLLQKCCAEISDAILKLIPKGPAND